MNRKFLFVLSFIVLFISNDIVAQKKKKETAPQEYAHYLTFHVKDSQDSLIYLAIHHKDNLYLKDTAWRTAPGVFVSKGSNRLDDGLYTLASQEKKSLLSFILDNNQHFDYFLDTLGNVNTFRVENSDENSEMLRFQKKTVEASHSARSFQEKIKSFEEAGMVDSADLYKEKFKTLNEEMNTFINDLIDKNPTYLFSKMQKAFQTIEVPDPPVNEDGSIDPNFQPVYYKTHYWDNVDLSDARFVYLPVLENKYNEYFHKILLYQHVDTIIRYVDLFLEKVSTDTVMFRYFTDRLTYDYQVSKIIGQDAVFVYIVKNYHLKGRTPWVDEDLMRKYKKRVDELDPLQIGKKAPSFGMPDMTGTNWRSTDEFPDKYMVLWFYDPTCGKCKKETAKLKVLYDSLEMAGTRNFEVFGVGNDSDIERWKKYVTDNQLPWINVGGNTATIDYIKFFGIVANPSMFILNKEREFILNKNIDVDDIPVFLEEYERIKEKKEKEGK